VSADASRVSKAGNTKCMKVKVSSDGVRLALSSAELVSERGKYMRNPLVTLLILSLTLFLALPARADTVLLKDGTTIEGVINKVEKGKLFITVDGAEKITSILLVESMDFNTPHLLTAVGDVPIDHFLKDVEAQEIVRNMKEIEKTAADLRHKLGQIRTYWGLNQPIPAEDKKGWDAAREEFRRPLERYQELLNDLYFHVLNRVDEYNLTAKEASKVYVGVKGLQIGSSLVSRNMVELPLRKYVPAAWYDTIFYDGYNQGYSEAYSEMNQTPKTD
jgi:hypothetical protein